MEPFPALDDILERHCEVKDQLLSSECAHLRETNLWFLAALVLLRSQTYGAAARLLLRRDFWEAAAVLTRPILEDAALLGYVRQRSDEAEQLAQLYENSEALEQFKFHENMARANVTSNAAEERMPEINEKLRSFKEQRNRLWRGERKNKDKRTWNGLSIKDTFLAAFPQAPQEYYVHYKLLCTLSHPSRVAANFAFQSQLGLDSATDEPEKRKEVADILVRALVWQLTFVEALLNVVPKSGVPHIG